MSDWSSTITGQQTAEDYGYVINTAWKLYHPDDQPYVVGTTSPYNDLREKLASSTNQVYRGVTSKVLRHLLDETEYGALQYASTGSKGTKTVLWQTATDLEILPPYGIESYCGLNELCKVIQPFAGKVVESAIADGKTTQDEVNTQCSTYKAALPDGAP